MHPTESGRPSPDGISGYTVHSCRDLLGERSSREAKGKGRDEVLEASNTNRRSRIRERPTFRHAQRYRRLSDRVSFASRIGKIFPKGKKRVTDYPLGLIYFDTLLETLFETAHTMSD